MARMRQLKPSFFTDPELADLPIHARVFYEGLWCQADREGRLRDEPRLLKIEILPWDDVDPEKLLEVLAKPRKSKPGHIVRYEMDGEHYIWIPKFRKHQRPHPKELASVIPPAPCEVSTGLDPDRTQTRQDHTQILFSQSFPSFPSSPSGSPRSPHSPPDGGQPQKVFPIRKERPPPVKLPKRSRTQSLAEEQEARRQQRRDMLSRQVFDWLQVQSRPVWDKELQREVERGPPTREQAIAWAQDVLHLEPTEALDAVLLAEDAARTPEARNGH